MLFPRPLTMHIQSREDLVRFSERALFPALLKPLSHREWAGLPKDNPLHDRKVMAAATPEELLRHYSHCETLRPQLPQMVRHGRLAHLQSLAQLVHAGIVFREVIEDAQA